MLIAKLKDIELAYEAHGQGEPVLFIHGLGSSTRDWEKQLGHFSERYRVIAVDLRGHGQSGKPPGPYSIRLFARDIAELIHLLGLMPAHVVGLSLGGFVAFQLAVDDAELLRSLVIVNSAPGLPRDRLRDRFRIAWALVLRRFIVRLFGMRVLGRFLSKKLFPRPEQNQLKARFIERWAENDRRAYLASLAAVQGWSLMDRLGEISCPTCVISGERDFIPLSLKQTYVAKLPRAALVVIPGSMHFTPLDQPDRFNEVLMAFLKEQCAESSDALAEAGGQDITAQPQGGR